MSEIPGELFAAAADLLLVDGFKVDMGAGANLSEITGSTEPAFFVTLEGRVNKSEERRTVHLMLHPELGYQLGDEIMSRLEAFVAMMKSRES